MPGMLIGEVARRTGLRPSTIRFYKRVALLPPPARLSKQRRYGLDAVGRLELIKLAVRSGFSIAETREFISGFTRQTPPAPNASSRNSKLRRRASRPWKGCSRRASAVSVRLWRFASGFLWPHGDAACHPVNQQL
jgi:DNA-binding transcriptional MerR regulator